MEDWSDPSDLGQNDMALIPRTASTGGNNQDPENQTGTNKRKNIDEHANKKQKTSKGNELEWIVRDAVEAAIRPLREELAQLKKIIQEKEQHGKKQEEGKREERNQNKSKQKENGNTEEKGKEKENEKKGIAQSYSQILLKNLPNKEKEWTTVTGKKAKKRFPIEQRRLLFKLEGEQSQNPKNKPQSQDLLHLANQTLRKKQADGISFIQLNYTPTGQISAVLNEQANREMVQPFLPAIQQAFSETKVTVCSIEAVQTWSKLKVHLVSIQRYFHPVGLELAREEIEATLGYTLPTTIRWLKKAEDIEKNKEIGKNHTSVVITVPNEDIAQNLKRRGLYFGGKKHPVEDFFNNSREVCPDCCQIGHRKDCTNPHKCFLCGGNHHRKNHQCKECKAKTPCKHIPLKCANCNGKHEAINPSCLVARGKREGKKDAARTNPVSAAIRSSPPPLPHTPQTQIQTQNPQTTNTTATTSKQTPIPTQTPKTKDTIATQEKRGTESLVPSKYNRSETPITVSSEVSFSSGSVPSTPSPMEMDSEELPSILQ